MSSLYYYLLLPQNYIAEEIIVGSIIVNPVILDFIRENIDTEHFFLETHKIIYRNLITLSQDSKNSIDPINLVCSLKKSKVLHYIGGIKLITELIKQGQIFNSSQNVSFYTKQVVKIIHSNYSRRLIIQYGYNIIKLAYNHSFSNYMLYIKASQYLNYIYLKTNSDKPDNLQNLIAALISSVQDGYKNIQKDQNLYSGFKDLDILTNGLPKGDLIVIAGRPSMGKTSFAMNITYHLVKYYFSQVCIFSLEMTKTQVLHKLISIGSNIPIQRVIKKDFNDAEWSIIQKICNEILLAKIYIDDTPNISTDEIKYLAQIVIHKNNVNQAIILDYLQLINEDKSNFESRNQELSYITRKLKILAQQLKVPIIVLSQLNRSIDKRTDKTPLLSDLKESGCINSNFHLDWKDYNKIYIRTIILDNIKIRLPYFTAKRHLYNKNYSIGKNRINQVYVLYEYAFLCRTCNNLEALTTDNHNYLKTTNWIKQKQLCYNHRILFLCQKHKVIEKGYIQKLPFDTYSIVFDLAKYKYTNLICNQIILHNSIEQDADIVMMLYKNSTDKAIEIKNSHKAIDIIISKNRSGPIGTLKLDFYPETTRFTSIAKNYDFYLN